MDDNNNPKLPSEESLDKLRKKANRYAAYIYIALAVCIVIVLSLSIYSMSFDFTDPISQSRPDSSEPSKSQNTSSNPPTAESENPVGGDVSGVTEESDIEPTQQYFNPVSGEIIKSHSMTALVFSKTMKDYRTHNGVDIKADIGTAVLSFTDGTISAITNDPLMGMTLEITHAHGMKSVYKNLAPTLAEGIEVGATIRGGEIIGAVGETAIIEIAEESHLHFEIWVDGVPINPQSELK